MGSNKWQRVRCEHTSCSCHSLHCAAALVNFQLLEYCSNGRFLPIAIAIHSPNLRDVITSQLTNSESADKFRADLLVPVECPRDGR